MASRIEQFARVAADDPFFLGAALADYAASEHLDDLGLASALGCQEALLTPLRLCRRPRPEPSLFRADIEAIVARFAVNGDRLAEAVRRSDALARLRGTAARAEGLLMAARDREPNDGNHDAPESTS
ncbi:MAG TPA: hypothetical protein VNL71_22875 [Chloroflexota bacterium]|nr:hypothetical protein [Chloroflexota bacterium]